MYVYPDGTIKKKKRSVIINSKFVAYSINRMKLTKRA